MTKTGKICPECSHEFKDVGWGGIDAHWRSRHSILMSYEEAWPLLQADTYKADLRRPDQVSGKDGAPRT